MVDSITHITTSWRLAFTEWRVQAVREQLSRDEAPPAVPDDGWIKQCIGLSVDSTINKFMPNASTWDRYIITEGYRKHFRAGEAGLPRHYLSLRTRGDGWVEVPFPVLPCQCRPAPEQPASGAIS